MEVVLNKVGIRYSLNSDVHCIKKLPVEGKWSS